MARTPFFNRFPDAWRRLDRVRVAGLTPQEPVLERKADPPGAPSTGDRYLVIAIATGAWATHEDDVAEYNGATWDFTGPTTGDFLWVSDESKDYLYDGTNWKIKAGVLERFLGVLDDEYDDLRDKTESVLDLRTPNLAPDEFIPLLGRLVGYEWNLDKSYEWNRQRIMIAIRRYSYKGTLDAVEDVIIEAGGDEWWILDMASTVIIPSRQGDLGTGNAYLVAPDYHHPGAYELQVTAAIDDITVVEDHLDRNTAAGEYWYLKTVPGTIPGDMAVRGGFLHMDSLLDLTKTEIQLHEGTSDNPLSELDAVIQACDETV